MQKTDPKAKTFKLIDSFEILKSLGVGRKLVPVSIYLPMTPEREWWAAA